ncbi:MAG: AAA family ATPase [Desulfuromonadales bacterium]|nr:AAA family ATPase [Desulfuromonadales bacterium]
MARVICVANQKGGVGKTTTAVNCAASLAVSEKRVLLVDMDPQGNATSGVGVEKGDLDKSIYDAVINSVDPASIIKPTEISHLFLLPAMPDLAGAELELIEISDREKQLKKVLSKLRNDYDFIIIDSPPSLGLLTVNAMAASDSLLIPLQCEFYAMEGLSQILHTLKLVQRSLNPALKLEGILLTMFDIRNNLSRQVKDEITKHFGDVVFNTIIPRNVRLSEAPSYGKPIILYDIMSKGAVSYLDMANELLKREGL